MKEVRYFYVPDAATTDELPADEAAHAVRVIRMACGDEMILMDGKGNYYRAEVTVATNKHCQYRILETLPQQRQWSGHFHLAIAPTKLNDRMEWMLEKATEVGLDEVSFLSCKFSERKVIKTERMERIVVSAVKQSHKAWMPRVNGIDTFKNFIACHQDGARFIAHCYQEYPRTNLFDEIKQLAPEENVTVLIGPEGDFSVDEVAMAIESGYKSVDLGASRLRTETAGLLATTMFYLR